MAQAKPAAPKPIVPKSTCLIIVAGYYTQYIEAQIKALMPKEIFMLVSREEDPKERACVKQVAEFIGKTHDFHEVPVETWTFEHVFGAVGRVVRSKQDEDCDIYLNISNGPREAIVPAVFAASMAGGRNRPNVIHTSKDRAEMKGDGFFRKVGGTQFDAVPLMPLRPLKGEHLKVIRALYQGGGASTSIKELVEAIEGRQFAPNDRRYQSLRTQMHRAIGELEDWGAVVRESGGKVTRSILTDVGRGVARMEEGA